MAEGYSSYGAAAAVGTDPSSVRRWARVAGMVLQKGRVGGLTRASQWRRSPRSRPQLAAVGEEAVPDFVDGRGRLTQAGRVLIQIRLGEQQRPARIAAELGVHRSTVGREIARTGQGRYRAVTAERAARQRRARDHLQRRKLIPGSRLRAQVVSWLDQRLSPEQISGRLRRDFADRDDMQVSHETIYQALYVQGAGSLRHELGVVKALRSGRTARNPRSRLPARKDRSWVGDAVFANRPAEACDRAVPGHWEGDLVIGATDTASALITLVERHTRFTLISRLDVHDTATVTERLSQMAAQLPVSMWRSLTWDQGVEMADHARFSITTGCPVFFCDPHSPWQRPTNENHNGLIRDFFPKGTNFSRISDAEVAEAERLLNLRPRKVLDYATPAEKLNELLTVAHTP
ncbi:IS30 family transposase [Desertihabitans brevis]|uniref:IS30 family transposase n=2 Tax=Desertihabitans brevis TaxID=2268447 RepID=A0A367YPX2_9ACTN|nr:IS30 family transposase [Desertihabitans brevis]